jgi:hypothetical protein
MFLEELNQTSLKTKKNVSRIRKKTFFLQYIIEELLDSFNQSKPQL